MSEQVRKELIRGLGELRKSQVITYVTSSRPNIRSDMDSTDIIHFRKHLEAICEKCNSLDLFIYSYGGELEVAWELVNLMREYHMDFNILIPYHAHSAATLLAFGAKEIIMGKMAALGPIDPTIRVSGGNMDGMEISVSDMDTYEDFLREEYNVTKPEEKVKAYEKLTENVQPVLIGRAYRNYLETSDDAKRLLRKYIHDESKVEQIVDYFIRGIHTHNHSISRREARKIGLNVKFTTTREEQLMWNLYREYEKAMQMDIPYIDQPPRNKPTREILFTLIESASLTSRKIGLQKFTKLDYPAGSILTNVENIPAVYLPSGTTVPVSTNGQLLSTEGTIYEKNEEIYWVTE